MLAILLVALFATIAVASVLTLADAAVRGRNGVRLLRGELGQRNPEQRVTVSYRGEPEILPFPPLRSLAISARRRVSRPAPIAAPRRVAA